MGLIFLFSKLLIASLFEIKEKVTEKFGNKIEILKIIYIAKSLIKSEVFFFYVKKFNAKSDL